MKATSLSCACMEAQLEMADFMLEYASRSCVFFYDGVAGATKQKVVGEVITNGHSGYGNAVPLLYLDGSGEEDFFLQYGANDPIPASVLPRITRDYIEQIVK